MTCPPAADSEGHPTDTVGEGAPKPALGSVDASLASLVDVARPYAELKEDVLERFQRVYLTELLGSVKGNQTAAAKLAGMDRTYLGRLLVRLGINGSGEPTGG